MNAFDRQVGLIRALSRLQPSHKKILSIFTDITATDVYILMTIYCGKCKFDDTEEVHNEPMSIKELRENFRGGAILPTAVSRSLKNLEEVGYIDRVTDKNDARKKYVKLTEQGYEHVKTFEKCTNEYWKNVYEEFGIERAKRLSDEINALADVLDRKNIELTIDSNDRVEQK